jgi:hypothetical protein
MRGSLVTSLNRISRQRCVCMGAVLHGIDFDHSPARISPAISAEVDVALKLHVPPCNEWTEVAIFNKLVDIIARVSGRVFVGEELCQDSEYLDCGSNYTINLMEAVHAIKPIRPWLRPFLVPRLPEIRKLRDMEKRAAKHLEPIVRERVEAAKRDPDWQKPDDMMQWMIDYSAKQGTLTVEYLAKKQLGLIFAAVHTTTTSVTNVLYSLAVTPEYVQPLRDEIVHVMSQNDGRITAQAMQQMVKLDSYMKEVTRFFPIGISTYLFPRNQHNIAQPDATCSILSTPRPQRHHPFQRPIHPTRRHNPCSHRGHSYRLGTLLRRLHLRRFPAPQTSSGRDCERPRAQPARLGERIEPRIWIRQPRMSGPFLRGQRDEDDCRKATAGLRHQDAR